MSYTYGFFDAVDLGSDNYDRVYSSAEFSHYWALLVGDGVFSQPSTSLNVLAMEPVAMRVKVAPGTGWIKGHYLTVPENMDEVIAIPVANPSLPRIDSIIMALNNPDRDMKLYVRSGTAAVSPNPVTLQRDADVWELELAQITVASGAGNITQTAIKDMRTDPDRCGIVTGLIDQFDVSGFFTAAQASFNEWFENVQGQLDGDVAGNLQNQINKNAADIAAVNSTILKADTKTALGLPASAGPDDAFKVLANVGNLHVWMKTVVTKEPVPAGYTLGAETNTKLCYMYYTEGMSVSYASSVSIDDAGNVFLVSPASISLNTPGDTLVNEVAITKGKFVKFTATNSSNIATPGVYFIPTDATFTYVTSGTSANQGLYCDKAQKVNPYPITPVGTTTDYLTSTDRNAYTEGTVDSTTITYLGQLGGGARIEVGSYVGTGTQGSANPTSLTFNFVPKMVIVTEQGRYGFALDGTFGSYSLFWIPGITYCNPGGSGSSSYADAQKNKITLSGKTLSWYRDSNSSNGNASHQLNASGQTYQWIALG